MTVVPISFVSLTINSGAVAGAIQTEPQPTRPPAIGVLIYEQGQEKRLVSRDETKASARAWLKGVALKLAAAYWSSRPIFRQPRERTQSSAGESLQDITLQELPQGPNRRSLVVSSLCPLGWPWDGRIQRGQPWFIQRESTRQLYNYATSYYV